MRPATCASRPSQGTSSRRSNEQAHRLERAVRALSVRLLIARHNHQPYRYRFRYMFLHFILVGWGPSGGGRSTPPRPHIHTGGPVCVPGCSRAQGRARWSPAPLYAPPHGAPPRCGRHTPSSVRAHSDGCGRHTARSVRAHGDDGCCDWRYHRAHGTLSTAYVGKRTRAKRVVHRVWLRM